MVRMFGSPYEQNLQGDYLYSIIYPNNLYMYLHIYIKKISNQFKSHSKI